MDPENLIETAAAVEPAIEAATPLAEAVPTEAPPPEAMGVVMSKANLERVFMTRPETADKNPELPAPRFDDYQITLPCFEGPLDLLLHLIRKEQLNIYDIPVARVCQSYLNHLELMSQMDFSIAGEFMVMASTLIYLKSVVLLPQDEKAAEEDPRQPLVAQLLEYDKFKRASEALNARPWLGRDLYGRSAHALNEILPQESLLDSPLEPIEPFSLLKAFKSANDRTRKPPMNIETDPVSIKDKVIIITDLLKTQEILEFIRLLPVESLKHDVIVTFLAMLELAKLKFVDILQTENFGPIQIRGRRSLDDLNMGMLDQY
jgi:segregation and condensation protein A